MTMTTHDRKPAHLADSDDGDVVRMLRTCLRVLYRRRRLVLAAGLLVFLASIGYTVSRPRFYAATAVLVFDSFQQNRLTIPGSPEQLRLRGLHETHAAMLKSRTLARRALDRLELWDHHEFNPRRTDGGNDDAPLLDEASGGGREAARAERTRTRTINRFLRSLRVTPVRNSRLINVTFRSRNANLAAAVANTTAREYLRLAAESRVERLSSFHETLSRHIEEQRRQVAAAELAVQQYLERHDGTSIENRQSVVIREIVDLSVAATQAAIRRIREETHYARLEELRGDPARIDTFPDIMANGVIQGEKANLAALRSQEVQLTETLGDRHPDLRKLRRAIGISTARIDDEIDKLIESQHNKYLLAAAEERKLQSEIEAAKAEATEISRESIEYGALQRDAEGARQLYERILGRIEETDVVTDLPPMGPRIVDEAEVPLLPGGLSLRMSVLAGLFGGLLIAGVLVVVLERFDDRIDTPDRLNDLRLPDLGMLPAGAGSAPETRAQLRETIRNVHANLVISPADPGCRSVAVTSAAAQEGKSFVSSHLADTLAQSDRVLIVDADFLRPRLHATFGVEREPGLSDVLAGAREAGAAIRKVRGNLSVLPAGSTSAVSAAQIDPARFRQQLQSLGSRFDWIVIDTAPLMLTGAAMLVAGTVNDVVFVIDATKTTRPSAAAALERLQRVNARVTGGILNHVDPRDYPRYYSRTYKRLFAWRDQPA